MAQTVTASKSGGGRSSIPSAGAGEGAGKRPGKNTARKSTGGKPPRQAGQSGILRV
jgi:hypothetical protein